MSNEDKILDILSDIQKNMKKMQADIDSLKNHKEPDYKTDHKLDDEGVQKQLETLNKMRHLLTKEVADALAAAVGEY